ncbi:lytic transglycosylase domain-containing protein [Futiania mangrovi]|uniref:Lytic transglycosylase domain-containing protein n=1 Tax=Futiania mangrovi TaxID=2959716 RepID=A0A9J6PE65_9PROT|nr:lytic transglycosylase domain-containing protein [Futiania mangrovii]MCP1336120.1 lytic transglycosylase domain-containing protein [Futiania mangrovii]
MRSVFAARVLLPLALALVPATLTSAREISAATVPLSVPKPGFRTEAFARAADAIAAAREGDWLRAKAAAARSGLPVANDVVRWLAFTENGEAYAFSELRAFLDSHPHWPGQWRIVRAAEKAALEQATHAEALAWFERHPPRTGPGMQRLGEALIATGKRAEGLATIRRAWREGHFSSTGERAFLDAHATHLQTADHVTRLDRLLWEGELSQAADLLTLVPGDARAVAEARIAQQRRARDADRLWSRLPASAQAQPGAAFDRARLLQRKGEYLEAISVLDRVKDTPPPFGAEGAWRIRHYLAREGLDLDNPRAAYAAASNHGLTEGVEFAEAEWLLGWIALRFLDDPARALPHFVRLFEGVSSPISLSRGAYWAGRAAEAQGDASAARGWYGKAAEHLFTYYGQLAGEKLGIGPTRLSAVPVPAAEDRRAFERRDLVQAARLLVELGLHDMADSVLFALARQLETAVDQVLLGEIVGDLDRDHRRVLLGKLAIRDGVLVPDNAFPLYGFPTFAEAREPELALVHALSRQESALNPFAVSPAGARGLMQLMPDTARAVASTLDLKFDADLLTADPAYNATLGMAHLRELLERYNGSYILTLAAYNAGPARPDEWIRRFGDPRDPAVDPVDWVERIPFSETRNYVQRIIESLQVYRARLDDGTLRLNTTRDLSRGNRP